MSFEYLVEPHNPLAPNRSPVQARLAVLCGGLLASLLAPFTVGTFILGRGVSIQVRWLRDLGCG